MTRIVLAGLLASIGSAASPETCAPCHRAETATFSQSGMARALHSAKDSAILRANPKLTTKLGGYGYEISDSTYSVTDGKETIRVPLEWAFGQGAVGQTFLFLSGAADPGTLLTLVATFRTLGC